MKEKTKFKARKALCVLAIISTCIATMEGLLFYNSDEYGNLFFRLLLVLQNSIYAFTFRTTISLKDAMNFMDSNPTFLNMVVGYAYGIAVFTAPYCTIAFLYKILERLFRLLLVTRVHNDDEHIVIFGYNEDVKILLNNGITISPKKDREETFLPRRKPKYRIHIVEFDGISTEEKYELMKKGYYVHQFDFRKASQEELEYLMKQSFAGKAKYILLMEESSINNFSLLQMFRLKNTEKTKRVVLREEVKIFCRCEDSGVERLIGDYYDNGIDREVGAAYDLELFSFSEYQVRAMYDETPLHFYYVDSELPIEQWDLNLLIIGFGKIGQQALLQAMNNGVFHGENKICIDVVDYNIEEKAGIFANYFSDDMFEMDNSHFKVCSDVADGSLEIRFHNMDVRYRQFHALMGEGAKTYNYVIIALSDTTTAMHCALELEEVFMRYGKKNVPIVMRMDYDKRVAEYVTNNETTFSDVRIMKDKEELLTLDDIVNDSIDQKAKDYHFFYQRIQIGETGKEMPWNKLQLTMRDSNRAVANHEKIKARFIESLIKEYGLKKEELIETLVGKEGKLLHYDGTGWKLNGEEVVKKQVFEQALRENRLGYEMAKMEHRRWTYFMLSRGWSVDKSRSSKRSNPCILPQEKLMKSNIEICQYDLMYLLAEYKKIEERNRIINKHR